MARRSSVRWFRTAWSRSFYYVRPQIIRRRRGRDYYCRLVATLMKTRARPIGRFRGRTCPEQNIRKTSVTGGMGLISGGPPKDSRRLRSGFCLGHHLIRFCTRGLFDEQICLARFLGKSEPSRIAREWRSCLTNVGKAGSALSKGGRPCGTNHRRVWSKSYRWECPACSNPKRENSARLSL